MSPIAILRIIAFYLLAVVVATILGGLVQAQIEIAALAETPLDLNERVAAGWPELLGLLPILAAILAVTLLITLPIAEALARIFLPGAGCCSPWPGQGVSGRLTSCCRHCR